MILTKEHVSLTTAAMKMNKIFTMIISTVANRKNASLGNSLHVKSLRVCHLCIMDFFEISVVVGIIEI